MKQSNNAEFFSKYIIEKTNERLGRDFNKDLIIQLEEELKELGLFEMAQERIKLDIEFDKKVEALQPYKERLVNIIKGISIWNIGKFDDELKGIAEALKKDESYLIRTQITKELMELDKFKKLDEDEKLKTILKLGALDFSDIMRS